jgi:pimeloyl-ACP methyl ester carboxylesterase
MSVLDVNGARLWYDESGAGDAVLLVHGGLGDSGLWDPVAPFLAERFRTIRTDLRHYGHSSAPLLPWSWQEDVVGVLDALGIERAALAGLSMGGGVALRVAQLHPDRVTAVVHVAGAVGPFELEGYDAGETRESEMRADFGVWAPLGVDDGYEEMWHATPEDTPPHRSVELAPETIAAPIYVITARHDPDVFRAMADRLPAARRAEVDSDHYLTLREPDRIADLIREFLA